MPSDARMFMTKMDSKLLKIYMSPLYKIMDDYTSF